jgi:hypothetical protein
MGNLLFEKIKSDEDFSLSKSTERFSLFNVMTEIIDRNID